MSKFRSEHIVVLAGGGVSHTSGGVGTLMQYLLDEWAQRSDVPAVRVIDTRGQAGIVGGIGSFLHAMALVLWLAANGRLSLIHAHMTTRGSVLRKCLLCTVARLCGSATIVHMHGADFFPFYHRLHPVYQSMVRAVLARAQHVVVLGEAWRRFLITEVGLEPAKVAIVLNGVPCPDTSIVASLRAQASEDRPLRIVFLGRLGDRKGVPELIEALGRTALRSRSWHATLAGDGEVERFREAIKAASLDDRVDMPGWLDREATASLLANADLFVLPSHHEAMPIAVLEALAFQVAVITTPVGAIPEFLEDSVSALLIPAGSVDDLENALLRLIDDAGTRRRIAAAGHGVFATRLEIAAVASTMLDLYESAMYTRGAPSGAGMRGLAHR